MSHLLYDESGTLVSGAFYAFDTSILDLDMFDDPPPDETWVVARRSCSVPARRQTGDLWDFMRVGTWPLNKLDNKVERHDCPISPKHVTHSSHQPVEVELHEGGYFGEFLPDEAGDMAVIISASFAEKLKQSGLTGFGLSPVTVFPDEVRKFATKLRALDFSGRDCKRPLKVVDVENACPRCGHSPVICQVCDYWPWDCPGCGKLALVGPEALDPAATRRLSKEAQTPQAGPVLSGRFWDGSDFFGSGPRYVTRRAIDWMQSVGAAPFTAWPVRVCTDGMSDEQRRRLDRAVQPLPQQ